MKVYKCCTSVNVRNTKLLPLLFNQPLYNAAESKVKLPHLFIPSKTATLVPEFEVEDLSLGRTTASVPEFAMKDLPLGRTLMMMMMMMMMMMYIMHT